MAMLQACALFFQMVASVFWMISVFQYDSWTKGDAFQLTAATSWTVSNFFALPDMLSAVAEARDQKALESSTAPDKTLA